MRYLILFLVGGGLYVLLELAWRNRTHVSMFFAGGLVLVLLYGLTTRFASLPLFLLCLLGAVVVTAVEFVFGAVLNGLLALRVWDYSFRKYNLYGQVCLAYSLLWFGLCVPVIPILAVMDGL